ncbi:MAG: sigma-70 family RNA polymerase sigma factor [Elusimicrobiota bacterium]|jgi:RNA polymerase sigma-70 factor (ECF subfamily)
MPRRDQMNDDPRLDPVLISAAVGGDQDAFAVLMRRHAGRVMNLCLSMLRDEASAEDAAQEVFLKAYRSLGEYRSESAFPTWLHRIAANHCLDALRRIHRRKEDSLESLLEKDPQPLRSSSAAGSGEHARFESQEEVRALLALLPPDYRLILTLREAQGLSYEEIAQTLDCSLDAVKARLRRARRMLLERHFSSLENV